MKTIFLVVFIFVFFGVCLSQDIGNLVVARTIDGKELHKAAAASLNKYVTDFLTKENVRRFGFTSTDEAASSTIGDPMQVLMIGLEDIQKFKRGSNPKTLLTDIKTWWFPVVNKNMVKTKLEMVERDGKFVAGELGGVKIVFAVTNSRQNLLNRLKERSLTPAKEIAVVKIPALMIILLITEANNVLYAVTAMTSPEKYGLKSGEVLRLDETLLLIKDVAVKIDPKKTM